MRVRVPSKRHTHKYRPRLFQFLHTVSAQYTRQAPSIVKIEGLWLSAHGRLPGTLRYVSRTWMSFTNHVAYDTCACQSRSGMQYFTDADVFYLFQQPCSIRRMCIRHTYSPLPTPRGKHHVCFLLPCAHGQGGKQSVVGCRQHKNDQISRSRHMNNS